MCCRRLGSECEHTEKTPTLMRRTLILLASAAMLCGTSHADLMADAMAADEAGNFDLAIKHFKAYVSRVQLLRGPPAAPSLWRADTRASLGEA